MTWVNILIKDHHNVEPKMTSCSQLLNQIIKNNPTMLDEMKFMSKVLKTGFININKKFSKNNFSLSIDEKLYQKYKFNYLTSKNIKGKLNHEIINSIL